MNAATQQLGTVQGPFQYCGAYWTAVRPDGTHVMNQFGKVHWPTRDAAVEALES